LMRDNIFIVHSLPFLNQTVSQSILKPLALRHIL